MIKQVRVKTKWRPIVFRLRPIPLCRCNDVIYHSIYRLSLLVRAVAGTHCKVYKAAAARTCARYADMAARVSFVWALGAADGAATALHCRACISFNRSTLPAVRLAFVLRRWCSPWCLTYRCWVAFLIVLSRLRAHRCWRAYGNRSESIVRWIHGWFLLPRSHCSLVHY